MILESEMGGAKNHPGIGSRQFDRQLSGQVFIIIISKWAKWHFKHHHCCLGHFAIYASHHRYYVVFDVEKWQHSDVCASNNHSCLPEIISLFWILYRFGILCVCIVYCVCTSSILYFELCIIMYQSIKVSCFRTLHKLCMVLYYCASVPVIIMSLCQEWLPSSH